MYKNPKLCNAPVEIALEKQSENGKNENSFMI